MFGISMPEMIVVLVIALIIIGPKRLPDLAKSLGRTIGEFKKAVNDLKDSMGVNEDIREVKKAFGEINENVKDVIDIGVAVPKEEKPSPSSSDAPHSHMAGNKFDLPSGLSTGNNNKLDMADGTNRGKESKDTEDENRR